MDYLSSNLSQKNSERKKCTTYGIEIMLRMSNLFNEISNLCKSAVVEFSKDLALNEDFEKVMKLRITDEKEQRLTVVKKNHASNESHQRQSPFEKIRGRKIPSPRNSLPRTRRARQLLEMQNQQAQQQQLPQIIQQESKPVHSNSRRKGKSKPGQKRKVPIAEKKNQSPQKEKAPVAEIPAKKEASASKQVQKSQNKKADSVEKQEEKNANEPPASVSIRIPRSKTREPIVLENSAESKDPVGRRSNRSNKAPIVLSISDAQLSSEPSDFKTRRASKGRSASKGGKRGGGRKKSGRKQKKQGEYKRPINGFMRFFQEIKDEIRKANKIKNLPDLSYLISQEWRKLSAREQDKYNIGYYSDLKKTDAVEKYRQATKRRESRIKKSKILENSEPVQNQQQQDDESIKNESPEENNKQANEDQASSSRSVQAEEHENPADEGESSANLFKKRNILKVKRPTQRNDTSEEVSKAPEEEQESGSEEFSVSDEDEEGSSGQDNSESSSEEEKDAKDSKSNSKSQVNGKVSAGKKK